MQEVEVITMRSAEARSLVPEVGPSYPRPGQAWDRWADELGVFPGGGLEADAAAHQQALAAAGWRCVRRAAGSAGEASEEWTAPPRQRRSVEEAGSLVRRAVMAANPRRMPPEAVEELCLWLVGFLEGLGDLLFYPDTEEPWARATTELRVARRESRRRGDPLRARFRDLVEVLEAALFSAPELGRGETTYATAQNKGRTRARWNEIFCSPSHVGAGSPRSLGAVERAADARWALKTSRADLVDVAGLGDWLVEEVTQAERVRRYRRRLASTRGGARADMLETMAAISEGGADLMARELTADLSDEAILGRLSAARVRLETHLRRIAPRADEVALATGDRSFLASRLPAEGALRAASDLRRRRQPEPHDGPPVVLRRSGPASPFRGPLGVAC